MTNLDQKINLSGVIYYYDFYQTENSFGWYFYGLKSITVIKIGISRSQIGNSYKSYKKSAWNIFLPPCNILRRSFQNEISF